MKVWLSLRVIVYRLGIALALPRLGDGRLVQDSHVTIFLSTSAAVRNISRPRFSEFP